MPSFARLWIGVVVLGLLGTVPATGQEREAPPDSTRRWQDDAWTPIVTREGVRISYIYYPEADTEHGGVVLRLDNDNAEAVRYRFTLIFRAPEADTTTRVQGTLGPGEMKTGEKSGLFWVPFKQNGYSVGEIGLRGLEISPVQEPRSDPWPSGPLRGSQ